MSTVENDLRQHEAKEDREQAKGMSLEAQFEELCKEHPNWKFDYWAKPVPGCHHDYEAVHKDYNGPGDDRAFTGSSWDDLIEQIKEHENDL